LYGKVGGPVETEEKSALEIIEARLALIRERLESDPEQLRLARTSSTSPGPG
jgi:hypothetical protein